jgi:hypothetical protein
MKRKLLVGLLVQGIPLHRCCQVPVARYEHLPIYTKAMDLAAVVLRSQNMASREKERTKR